MTAAKSSNTVWQESLVKRAQREALNGHGGVLLWFTGLSGAGKSSLARAVEAQLHALGIRTYVLDGDNVRHGLCGDLGFSIGDRSENIRRIGEVGKLFVDAGVVVLAAFISPMRQDRERVRQLLGPGDFIEVYCQCPVEVCETRDVKGLYKRARAGEVKEFTGISAPYEEPQAPELTIETSKFNLEQSVQQVLNVLKSRKLISQSA
jgi:adenylylsulfate kinase